MDSFKTELIADRVWRTRAQLELQTVEYLGWFNHERLHESLGDIPPAEFEQRYAASHRLNTPISVNGSVAAIASRPANGFRTRRIQTVSVDFAANHEISPVNALIAPTGIRSCRDDGGQGTNGHEWPLRRAVLDQSLTQ